MIVEPLRKLGRFAWQIVDRLLIDGAITAGTWAYRVVGLSLKQLQFGNLRAYAHYLIFGVFLLAYLYFMRHMPEVFRL